MTMLSRFLTPAASAFLSATLVACGGSSPADLDPLPPRTITGTITVPSGQVAAPVVIGDFAAISAWSSDTINSIDGISPYTLGGPHTVAGGSAARTFTYTLPTDPATFGLLVGFLDLDEDGLLDFPGEPMRFAVKQIEGTAVVLVTWGSAGPIPGTPAEFDYVVGDGVGNNWGLLVVGTSGLTFTF